MGREEHIGQPFLKRQQARPDYSVAILQRRPQPQRGDMSVATSLAAWCLITAPTIPPARPLGLESGLQAAGRTRFPHASEYSPPSVYAHTSQAEAWAPNLRDGFSTSAFLRDSCDFLSVAWVADGVYPVDREEHIGQSFLKR